MSSKDYAHEPTAMRISSGYDPTPLADTLIIGFGHKARHGKDWAAKTIAEAVPGVRVLNFATSLKAYCRVAFGMRGKDARLLQVIGTDVLRAKEPDIFVRVLYDTLCEDPPKVVLIPDVRFPNEAQLIKDVGGFVIKVVRLQAGHVTYTPYVSGDRDPNHPSETALDQYTGWDGRIVAVDGDLPGLESQALDMYQQCLDRRVVRQQQQRRVRDLAGNAPARLLVDSGGGAPHLSESVRRSDSC